MEYEKFWLDNYTFFRFKFMLSLDTPKNVLTTLKWIKENNVRDISTYGVPNHVFFKTSHYHCFLADAHRAAAHSSGLCKEESLDCWPNETKQIIAKNKDGYKVDIFGSIIENEDIINKFIDWMSPYIVITDTAEIGHSIYFNNGITRKVYTLNK